MAGANMSGDLKNPARSIPTGTLAAIAFTGVIYLALTVVLAASRTQAELVGNSLVMKQIAWSAWLINGGVFAATFSSALGSMMGAPRILQAFARDDIFKWLRRFGRGSGPSDEPRHATVLTFAIAQGGVMLGDLNAVAPIITMFFMITYGTLNLACFYEAFTGNPSYRPRFRLSHWSMSLLGAAGCVAVMFLVNPIWATLAIAGMAGLYAVIRRAEFRTRWGDVTSGVAFERARKALLKLEKEKFHPKNWRPAILALSGGAWNRIHLAEYAYWLGAGRGIVSLGQIIGGEIEDRLARRHEAEKRLRQFIQDEELAAFPAVVVEEDLGAGLSALLQCHGIGGLRPNTLLLGWSDDPQKTEMFGHVMRLSRNLKRNVLIVGCEEDIERWAPPHGTINVWWRNAKQSSLMLLLAHLLKQNAEWRDHPLRLLCPVPLKADKAKIEVEMQTLVDTARIAAEVVVLEGDDAFDSIQRATAGSALLFAGFEPPAEGEEWDFKSELGKIVALPGDVILVYNAGDVSLEA